DFHVTGVQTCDLPILYNYKNDTEYVKDGINDYVVDGKETVNPEKNGSKFAVWHHFELKAGEEKTVRLRLSKNKLENPWGDFDDKIGRASCREGEWLSV